MQILLILSIFLQLSFADHLLKSKLSPSSAPIHNLVKSPPKATSGVTSSTGGRAWFLKNRLNSKTTKSNTSDTRDYVKNRLAAQQKAKQTPSNTIKNPNSSSNTVDDIDIQAQLNRVKQTYMNLAQKQSQLQSKTTQDAANANARTNQLEIQKLKNKVQKLEATNHQQNKILKQTVIQLKKIENGVQILSGNLLNLTDVVFNTDDKLLRFIYYVNDAFKELNTRNANNS